MTFRGYVSITEHPLNHSHQCCLPHSLLLIEKLQDQDGLRLPVLFLRKDNRFVVHPQVYPDIWHKPINSSTGGPMQATD